MRRILTANRRQIQRNQRAASHANAATALMATGDEAGAIPCVGNVNATNVPTANPTVVMPTPSMMKRSVITINSGKDGARVMFVKNWKSSSNPNQSLLVPWEA